MNDGMLVGAHDVADGGLGVALAEMAVRSGVGFAVAGVAGHAGLFSEAPSRVVVCVAPDRSDEVVDRARRAGVAVSELGRAGGYRLLVDGLVDVALDDAHAQWSGALPKAMRN
ncbi:MAG: hypothetical protein H0T70_05780 [Acidimicrobiia bacterium]|nr:hypothetical protein [Acidimicrobiia bacterium]